MGVAPSRACVERRGLSIGHQQLSECTSWSCMSIEQRVKIKLRDGGEGTGRIVKPSMRMADLRKDRLKFRTCVC
jgi:hypothetical protein